MTNLEENKNIFKSWVQEYSSALKIKDIFYDDKSQQGFLPFMLEFKNFLYDSIHNFLSKNTFDKKFELTIRAYCKFIEEKILPVCNKKIEYYNYYYKEKDCHVFLNKWIDLQDDFYALACYRNLKLFAYYLDTGKSEKHWEKTMPLFENFFDYSQRMVFGEQIELIRASYFPGAGKTFAGNILCAWWFGYDSEISILRITYSDDLCSLFIRQIADIIDSKQYRKVFPKFNVGEITGNGNTELYSKYSISVGFQFKFSSVMNFFASTRDGQTTGKRGKVLMIDDLTKGRDEAYDDKLHLRMAEKFDTEWASRADSSYQPVIALGTMWSKEDLLNVLYNRAIKDTENMIRDDEKYKYTMIALNEDGSLNSVFISTPILDYDTDESTCPARYTTKAMRKKREHMDEALWNAVYQQRPTPPEEFIFDYKNLITYSNDNIPQEIIKNENCQTYAFIDPTRKGDDFFAMGIFRRYRINDKEFSKWHLVDCLFEQIATKDLYYDIAYKIVNHGVTVLGYENNIDVSLEEVIKTKIKDISGSCQVRIDSFFSAREKKEMKIRNASSGMKIEIVYPNMKLYSSNSPMGKGMHQLTTWNISRKYGDHDDFPDMVAMFVKYYCEQEQQNTMVVLDRSIFSLR